MADADVTFTQDDLQAARALFSKTLADCPFCLGYYLPDPRMSPTRANPCICLDDAREKWLVRCFSCSAQVSSAESSQDVVARWNRRPEEIGAVTDMLPYVDTLAIAQRCDTIVTPAVEAFAIEVQKAVVRRNRRTR